MEFISQKLQTKAKLHDEIRVLAKSKLNSVADHISVALNDDKVSKEEFKPILAEFNKHKIK